MPQAADGYIRCRCDHASRLKKSRGFAAKAGAGVPYRGFVPEKPRFGQDAETRALLEGERALPLQGSEVHSAGEAEAAFRHINARAFPCRAGKRKSAGLKERSSEIFPSRPRGIHADSGAGTGKGFLHERDGRFPAFLGKPEAAHFFRQAVEAAESREIVRLSLLPVKIRGKRRRAHTLERAQGAVGHAVEALSKEPAHIGHGSVHNGVGRRVLLKKQGAGRRLHGEKEKSGESVRAGKKTAQDKVQTDIRAQNGIHEIRGLPFHGKGQLRISEGLGKSLLHRHAVTGEKKSPEGNAARGRGKASQEGKRICHAATRPLPAEEGPLL